MEALPPPRPARDDRLRIVARVLWVVAGVGVASAAPTWGRAGPVGDVGRIMVGAVSALWVAYGVVAALARAERYPAARRVLFGSWVGYLFVHLAMFRPELGIPITLVFVGIANAFTALIVVGVQVLAERGATRPWTGGALVAYALGALVAASRFTDPELLQAWLTTAGLSVALLGCAAGFAEVFARDLAQALAQAETLQAELERAAADARAASEAKSRFLADMSHELRTPLTGILGYVELLLESPDATRPEVEADLEHVRQAALHLNTIVGDVLDLAKIEAGKLTVDVKETPLLPILEEVAATARPMAARRRNELVMTTNHVPAVVRTDGSRLRQVLLNLLSNASKFTEGGSISVLVEGVDEGARILVSDTGIGIPPDKLDSIFEPFEQVDPTTTKRFGGTGLGLAISRRILLLMGSDLSVSSRPGEGSTFTFVVPSVDDGRRAA